MAPPCSAVLANTLAPTNANAELVSSLLGNLAEHPFGTSRTGEIFVTEIDSYKERFRKTKAELLEAAEEKRKLEQDRETLRRAHVYDKILAELHELWWPKLPKGVKHAFVYAGRDNLPNTIVNWWLQWEDESPAEFPLPSSLCHFGPVTLKSRGRFIFDQRTGEESELSKAVLDAWNFLPDTIRHLMLFSWAGAHSAHLYYYNNAALPDIGNSTAEEILNSDFHDTFENLHATACYIAKYLFDGSE